MTLSGDYDRYGWKAGDVVMVPRSEDDASAERYMWQPGDVVFESAVDDLTEDRGDAAGGYNPYRASDGKFAPGAHKAKAGGAGKPTADAATRKTGGRKPLTKEQEIQKAFVHVARGEHAKAKAIFDKHGFAIPANVVSMGRAEGFDYRHSVGAPQPKSASPKSADVHAVVAKDKHRMEFAHGAAVEQSNAGSMLHHRQFSAEAQAAIREHHDAVLATYGLHNRDADLMLGRRVEVRTSDGMAGAIGLHWNGDGRVALDVDRADGLIAHARLNAGELKQLGGTPHDPVLQAYRVSTHEAVHGHGPDVQRHGPYTMLEEMSTEMVARRVVADVHGMEIHHVVGSYGRYIDPTVSKIAQLSGKTTGESHAALAHAALEFKREKSATTTPYGYLHNLGSSALRHLGVTAPEAHGELYDHMINISHGAP